jgi:hypothetical protein
MTGPNSAIFSACGNYRYRLERRWDDHALLGWVMLNPSTADAERDDPTIRRCVGFAKQMGFSGIVVCNLFAWRATNPKELELVPHPVGDANDGHLLLLAKECSTVIAGWGGHGRLLFRDRAVMKLMPNLQALGLTKTGCPRHPLYLPYSSHVRPLVHLEAP